MDVLTLIPAASNEFKAGTLLKNGAAWLNTYGSYVIIGMGIIAIIAAIGIAIAKFVSKGQSQFKWVHVIGLVLVGAIAIATQAGQIQDSTAANMASGTGSEVIDVGSDSYNGDLNKWSN